jgi:AraC-like DNA-binding protein
LAPLKRPFHYFEAEPGGPASKFVSAYWGFDANLPEGEEFEHHLWPDGCISLGAHVVGDRVAGAFVVGATLRAHRTTISGVSRYFGVKFRPEAGAPFLGLDPGAVRDRIGPITSIGTGAAQSFVVAIGTIKRNSDLRGGMDRWIASRLEQLGGIDVDDAVGRAGERVVATRGNISVSELAREVGLSPRQLRRRFVGATGLTPKEFVRIRRVRSAIAELLERGATWSRVAAELGYADHSHLVRDVSEVTGLTPSALSERIRLFEHTAVTP